MVQKLFYIIILLLLTMSTIAKPDGNYGDPTLLNNSSKKESIRQGDSIMQLVIKNADRCQNKLSHYEADIYIKGRSKIVKQNFLMLFAHHIFPVDRKTKDMFFEMLSHSQFNAPNSFLHDFKAINGNTIPNNFKQKEVLTFLNLNVYSPTIYNEGIITPIAEDASKFYKFNLDSTFYENDLKIFKIHFTPKQWSQKLISGYLYIIDKTFSIDKIDMDGYFSLAEFNLVMTFGKSHQDFILPATADLKLRYSVLGNEVVSTYHSSFKYEAVEWVEENDEKNKRSLDLSAYFDLSSDTIPIINDSTYWKSKRDIPITPEEGQMYHKEIEPTVEKVDTGNIRKYLKLTEKLTNTIDLDYKTTRLKYSGLLNPVQFGYSGSNGITYWQMLRLSKTFAKDRQLRFRPEIGYVFKRKQLFFTVAADWEYRPDKLGTLSLSIGNSNEGYSSEMMKEINELLKDSTFNIDDLNFDYFKHYYVELRNNIELFNGFQLSAGLSYHRRIQVKKDSNKQINGDISDILNGNYNDFTPVIGISYTPRQYYWMDGYRKEYIHSFYPTMSLEVATGIPGVGKSTGDYWRIEADIHQRIKLGLARRFNYHISGGMFINAKSIYFADFHFFARRNFPESWADRFGGVFNQLRSEWYNASDKYVQAHFMYESPFILMQLLKPKPRASRYILSERFYLSQLWLPVMPSYTEIGYGVGSSIFNIAIFAGFKKLEYQSIGLKFTFELFQ